MAPSTQGLRRGISALLVLLPMVAHCSGSTRSTPTEPTPDAAADAEHADASRDVSAEVMPRDATNADALREAPVDATEDVGTDVFRDSPEDSFSTSCPPDTGTYGACGCGCCGGVAQTDLYACYYPSRGETIEQIMASDQQAASDPGCALVGCSAGQSYVCCDEEPAGDAGAYAWYSASYLPSGADRIEVRKGDPVHQTCVVLSLVRQGAGGSLAIDLPSGWRLASAWWAPSATPCLSGSPLTSTVPATMGAGTIRLVNDAPQSCRLHLDVELTFAFDGGATDIQRLAAHGLPVQDLGSCP